MKILTIILLLLIPTLAPAEEQRIIRDQSGSVAYTKQRYGNQIIYRDRSWSIIGTENLYGSQKIRSKDRDKVPLLERD
jgi:hypothetical protein